MQIRHQNQYKQREPHSWWLPEFLSVSWDKVIQTESTFIIAAFSTGEVLSNNKKHLKKFSVLTNLQAFLS